MRHALGSLGSEVVDAVLATDESVHSLRFISEFRRGPDVVHLNDWVALEQFEMQSMSARVESIVQTAYSDTAVSYIRMWCTHARPLLIDEEFTQWSQRHGDVCTMLVLLETTQLRVLACTVESERYVFN